MNIIYIIAASSNLSAELTHMISIVTHNLEETPDTKVEIVQKAGESDFRNQKIIFAAELDDLGFDISMLQFFKAIKARSSDAFQGSVGALLIHSCNSLGTKRAAQDIIFLANNLGCRFIGHPLVEYTEGLKNFLTWQKVMHISLEDICVYMCKKLSLRLLSYNHTAKEYPYVLVLYSSPHKTSNTLDLWHMISDNIKDKAAINEVQIDNGSVQDCKGCSYKLCLHYGKQNSCFYGGYMVKNILPEVEKASAVVFLCPNYNDAVSANLTATINRLTVLYYKISFYEKSFFPVVVSGNSGSDSVAKQLIGALNINKGFCLPPYAVCTAIANDPGAIYKVNNIENIAKTFAENMINEI